VKSGLLWQKCPAGSRGDNCSEGLAKIYTWEKAKKYCEKLDWAGKKWRIPEINELISLRHCKKGKERNYLVSKKDCENTVPSSQKKACDEIIYRCSDDDGFPVIDSTIFPNTETSGFWSATQSRTNSAKAWGMTFDQGYTQTTGKTNRIYLRCVTDI